MTVITDAHRMQLFKDVENALKRLSPVDVASIATQVGAPPTPPNRLIPLLSKQFPDKVVTALEANEVWARIWRGEDPLEEGGAQHAASAAGAAAEIASTTVVDTGAGQTPTEQATTLLADLLEHAPVVDVEINRISRKLGINRRSERNLSGDDFDLLVEGIRQNGLLHPIVLWPQPGGEFELVAGERRSRACEALGWRTIRASLVHFPDVASARFAMWDENRARRSFDLEETVATIHDLQALGLNQTDIAARMGLTQGTISSVLKIHRNKRLARAVTEDSLSVTFAHEIQRLYTPSGEERVPGAADGLLKQVLTGEMTKWKLRDSVDRILASLDSGSVSRPAVPRRRRHEQWVPPDALWRYFTLAAGAAPEVRKAITEAVPAILDAVVAADKPTIERLKTRLNEQLAMLGSSTDASDG